MLQLKMLLMVVVMVVVQGHSQVMAAVGRTSSGGRVDPHFAELLKQTVPNLE